MRRRPSRATWGLFVALAAWTPVWVCSAQQPAAPAAPVVKAGAPQPRQEAPRPAAAAESPVVTEAAARPIDTAGRLPQALSPWSMFLNADILVKAVMIGLAFASLITWTIFFAKSLELFLATRRLGGLLVRIVGAKTLVEAQLASGARSSIVSALLAAAAHEFELSAAGGAERGVLERIASSFADVLREEARAIRRGMGLLATIGSTAPFVGLFGTVWGIMNSFIGISKAQTTNLAVVAPGIAEALLATAIGLAAAIPAVIVYNHFARKTRAYLDLARRASGTVERLVSRDLDRTGGKLRARVAE